MNLLFSCIGRRGYIVDFFKKHLNNYDKIIGTSNTKWTVGFEKCDINIILPDILDDSYVPRLLEVCQDYKVDVLISFFDLDIHVLSKYKEEFKKIGVLPLIPSFDVSIISFDKLETFNFLNENNFNTPKTYINKQKVIDDIEFGKINYPLIIKPRYGFGSREIYTINNEKELEFFLDYSKEEMIIQEKIPGVEYHIDILNDFKKNVISVVPKKKISMRSGETDQAKVLDNEDLKKIGQKIGEKLNTIGPIDIDLFLYNNKYYILEINPRFGGGYLFSHMAGTDHPGLIMQLLKEQELDNHLTQYNEDLILMKKYDFFNKEISEYDNNIIDKRN